MTVLDPAVPPRLEGRRPDRSGRRPSTRRPVTVVADAAVALLVATVLVAGRSEASLPVAVAVVGGWPLLVAAAGGYRRGWAGPGRRAVGRAGVALGATAWLLSNAAVLPSAEALTTTWALVGASWVVRTLPQDLTDRWTRRRPARGPRVLLVGAAAALAEVDRTVRAAPGIDVVGAWSPDGDERAAAGGAGDLVADLARDADVDAVLVVPGGALDGPGLHRLSHRLDLAGRHLLIATGLQHPTPRRTSTAHLGELAVLQVAPAPLDGPARRFADLAGRAAAALLLVLILPVLAALAVAVRLDSAGPVLFRQERVGRDGRPFSMLKLRSMVSDAEAALPALLALNQSDGALFKIRADPRVTRVGRVLRRFSLDELPQLLNVVRGEMALVGPRPALPREVATYDDVARRRLAVKPGLTGLWQVSGRADLGWDEGLRLDLQYVDHWSLALEASILCRTAGAVLGRRGAY